MEDEINIEESCAILSAVKLLTRLRSSIASYSYSHRLDSSCARRLTRARDTVSQYLDRGSLLHRGDSIDGPLRSPASSSSLSLSLSTVEIDRDIAARKRERESSFFSRWPPISLLRGDTKFVFVLVLDQRSL